MKEAIKDKPLMVQIGTLVSVCLFIIYSTWWFAGMNRDFANAIDRINSRVDHLSDKYTGMRTDIVALQTQNNEVKVKLATLEAILTRIELSINEIKKR